VLDAISKTVLFEWAFVNSTAIDLGVRATGRMREHLFPP
jgi:hypothetical protein